MPVDNGVSEWVIGQASSSTLRAWCESHLERHRSPTEGRWYLQLDENGAHRCALEASSGGGRCRCTIDTSGRAGLMALEKHLLEVHGRTFTRSVASAGKPRRSVHSRIADDGPQSAQATPAQQQPPPRPTHPPLAFTWSRSLFVVASELSLMDWGTQGNRPGKVLAFVSDILDRSVDLLARELLVASRAALAKTGCAPPDTTAAQLYADARECACEIARLLLAPSSPRGCALPCLPSSASVLGAIVQGIPNVVDEILLGPKCRHRKRPRIDEVTSAAQEQQSQQKANGVVSSCAAMRTAVFCRNAFRGPHTTAFISTGDSSGDASAMQGVTASSIASWYRALAGQQHVDDVRGAANDDDQQCRFVVSLRDAHASQFLCNGIVAWLRSGHIKRSVLERTCVALHLGPTAVQLASILELADFVACAMLPPPGVMASLMRRSGLLLSWGATTECKAKRPQSGGRQAAGHCARSSATSLTAIGEQSKALEATEHRLLETIVYRDTAVSRKELLQQLASRCMIPFADIVAAMAEQNDRDADVLTAAMTLGAPTLPTRDAFSTMSADETEEYMQSMLRCQFRTVQGHLTDRALTLLRAQHLARVPLDALYVLARASATRDPYEQLLMRFWRIPFSSQTTLRELRQWVWPSEIHVMAMNLLSYLDDDAAKVEAIRASGIRGKGIDVTLRALEAFLRNASNSGGDLADVMSKKCLLHLVALLLRRRRVVS